MFRTFNWKRGGAFRLLLFMLVVSGILFYVASRRPVDQSREDPGVITIRPIGPAISLPATSPITEFFVDYRLERDSTRQHQLDLLREMIDNPNTDESSKKEASRRLLRIVDNIGRELEIEGLIRAKGYEDALVFLNDTSATVVVKTPQLAAADVSRIADIVIRNTGLKQDAISILSLPY
ncbi:MAG: SpoIIIAH-like family protein [Bacillota bacterium]